MMKFKEYFSSLINESKYYHGTIDTFVDSILRDGKIISNKKGSSKISTGINSEVDFVYLTPDFNVAAQFAQGVEASSIIRKALKREFGAVFEVELPDNIRLIDIDEPLSEEQINIVNKFLPDYKPLKLGNPLRKFWWRTNNPEEFSDVIRSLGFDGYIQDTNQIAILDEVKIKAHYKSPDEYISSIQI
jgi:hypothetical protein